jgi:ABC-2 type transport system ATP-binding protein
MSNEYWAELSGAKKKIGKTVALDGLDLQVSAGELFSVLGPNGAGKSTAISLLLGLLKPDSGAARLFGLSPYRIEPRRQIGVMMQEVTLAPELRVREHIALVASYYPHPFTAAEAMDLTNISSLASRPYGKLSAGQKRQVQFAMAVCGRPKLLFLDEPSVGLDVRARGTMWATLRQLVHNGSSIVLTTHYLEEAESLSNRVAVLNKGRLIASGTVNEIRALVVRKHITCSTALAADQIAAWPDVESVTRDQHRLQISTSNSEAVVRRLLAADSNLQELEVRRAGLAEAFTELTQEAA